MKKEFSKSWKSSKQPRKQRKYRANAPLHIRRKFVGINLSKDLRKKHSIRNIVVRVGDLVKIMRGKFKLKQGKITKVYTKTSKVEIENIQVKKMDGSKSNVKMQPSNLQDSKRLKNFVKEIKTDKESSKKIEEKDEKIKTTKKVVSKETNKENKK